MSLGGPYGTTGDVAWRPWPAYVGRGRHALLSNYYPEVSDAGR